MIDWARSLGLPVIAEGIEHQQEMLEIIRPGGEYGQGFYFGRAIPAAEATLMAKGVKFPLKRA